ncbi:LysE family translocator [Gluconacetobacter asukensis]|uniref:LysE family translocator n=2 Tax=Gluconacetobacter asukensis TaxID=1017181 RepID=A0A7W4IYC4_9PROT|nr:LysE family translocator [Gluconacetobacter asukensis]
MSLAAFTVSAAIFTMSPGLDTATVLRTSTISGAKSGLGASLGITGGLLVWGVSAAFGLTALLAASTLAFNIVKWAGAAYLFYLGIGMLLCPRTGFSEDATEATRKLSPAAGFRQGFMSNILNPKVGIFYITFLPQFIPHGVNVILFSLVLAGLQVVMSMSWLSLLVALTVPFSHILSRPAVVRQLDRLTGCIFMGFGLKLALTDRH